MNMIEICVFGYDYKASNEMREKASLTESRKLELIKIFKSYESIYELAVLSTCNRIEIYYTTQSKSYCEKLMFSVISDFLDIESCDLQKFSYFKYNLDAVLHLFSVAAGFKSQLIGEDQILGQVKDAYFFALKNNTSAKILNRMFLHAITAAKKIKTGFGSLCCGMSVSLLAAREIEEEFSGELEKINVLVIGAGKIGELALKYLSQLKNINLYITNRTHKTKKELNFLPSSAKIIEYNNRYSSIDLADAVITATYSPHYTVKSDMLPREREKKLLIIDLAVPRDTDPAITAVSYVKFVNMDMLIDKQNAKNNMKLKKIKEAEIILSKAANKTYGILKRAY